MDNRWYNADKKENMRKRHTLHSLGVGVVFFVALFILTNIFKVSLCPFKHIFGISCFGCGMTRGFIAIINLDFKLAYEYNVLSIPLFLGITIYCCFAIIDILFNKNYIYKIEKLLAKKYMYIIYSTILILATALNNTK